MFQRTCTDGAESLCSCEKLGQVMRHDSVLAIDQTSRDAANQAEN